MFGQVCLLVFINIFKAIFQLYNDYQTQWVRKDYTVITKWPLKSPVHRHLETLTLSGGIKTQINSSSVSYKRSKVRTQTNSSGVWRVRGQCFWPFEQSCPTTQQIQDIDVDFNRLTIMFWVNKNVHVGLRV